MKSKVLIGLTIIYVLRLAATNWTLDTLREMVFGVVGGVLLMYWIIMWVGKKP